MDIIIVMAQQDVKLVMMEVDKDEYDMNLKNSFKEWNDHKKKAKQKMVDCPWGNFSHKTWPDENCIRCGKPVDKDGNPIHPKWE